MLFVIFIIPREICNMDMQLMQMDILLHVCIIFRFSHLLSSNKLSYFRIQQIKLSFIHICILIMQFFLSFYYARFLILLITHVY